MALRHALWFLVALLCGFGLWMIASTTGSMVGKDATTLVSTKKVLVQAGAMGLGLAGAWLVSVLLGADRLRRDWVVALLLGGTAFALLAVLAVGREVNGARRWIDLGPVNLQPAELAKLAVVVGAAWYFTRAAERVRAVWHGVLVPLLGFAVLGGLVYATKDLGSVVVMAVVLTAVIAFAGANLWYYLGLVVMIAPLAVWQAAWSVGYRRDRMLSFTDPLNLDGPTAFHLKQSFIAIGSGGTFGVGLGQSSAKLNFLPEHHTDFIYAVVCEEFGLVGGIGLAAAFLALIGVGLAIAWRARDLHHRLLAVGATVVLGFQAFGNMLVATGSVPTKGMTLPFISYGGSSVMVCLVLVGIIDAVARAEQRALEADQESGLARTSQNLGARVRTRKTWHGDEVADA
jgi:cell division protein FtsW